MTTEPIDIETADEEQKSAYRIGGKSEAAWGMQKLRGYMQRQQENDKVAADRIKAVENWRKEENDKLQHSVDYFEGLLLTWHMSQVQADPSDEAAWKKEPNKTISLPDGKLVARRAAVTPKIDDEAFIPWARANHPEWVRPKYEPEKQLIKQSLVVKENVAYDANGEQIPGIEIPAAEATFEVKPELSES